MLIKKGREKFSIYGNIWGTFFDFQYKFWSCYIVFQCDTLMFLSSKRAFKSVELCCQKKNSSHSSLFCKEKEVKKCLQWRNIWLVLQFLFFDNGDVCFFFFFLFFFQISTCTTDNKHRSFTLKPEQMQSSHLIRKILFFYHNSSTIIADCGICCCLKHKWRSQCYVSVPFYFSHNCWASGIRYFSMV